MQKGFVFLHRKIQDNPIWKSSKSNLRDVMINILLMVAHKEREWIWQGKKYKLTKGQMITSYSNFVDVCGVDMTIGKLRKILKKLVDGQFITIETTPKSTLITVINWQDYQYNNTQQPMTINDDITSTTKKDFDFVVYFNKRYPIPSMLWREFLIDIENDFTKEVLIEIVNRFIKAPYKNLNSLKKIVKSINTTKNKTYNNVNKEREERYQKQ